MLVAPRGLTMLGLAGLYPRFVAASAVDRWEWGTCSPALAIYIGLPWAGSRRSTSRRRRPISSIYGLFSTVCCAGTY